MLNSPSGIERVYRKVDTICPVCLKKIEGYLLEKDNSVSLHRKCDVDGVTEIVLSHNPQYYSDLDRFYFDVLKKGQTRGKITNYWILSTYECQMQCDYCHADVQNPIFQQMDKTDFEMIIQQYKKAKLTLSGGESTLHPNIFYFFEHARKYRRCTQLATNGLNLADEKFCQRLKESGVKEIRISFEALTPIPEHSKIYEFNKYLDMKLLALKQLEKGDFSVSLSPTIFKGINENLLLETLNYAKNRYYIKEISVNGFSWAGHGVARDSNEMIMPDEMMDIICNDFRVENRENVFIFQKAIFSLLHLLNIRICMYIQIMIFVRRKGKLELIIDYLNMGRMKKALNFWEKFSNMAYIIQLITFCLAMIYSITPKTFFLAKDIFKMILANIFKIDFSKYPHRLLPIVINTNCSTLTADEEVSKQCMSAVIYKRNNRLNETFSTYPLSKIKL